MSNKSEKGKHQSDDNQTILGMPVDDMISGAQLWWENKGKDMMRNRQFSKDMKAQGEALNAVNPIHPNYIGESNILKGASWFILRPDEKFRVVKFYTVEMRRVKDDNHKS